jgi:hypothetical protein
VILLVTLTLLILNLARLDAVAEVRCCGNSLDLDGQPALGAHVTLHEGASDGLAGYIVAHGPGDLTTGSDGIFVFVGQPRAEDRGFLQDSDPAAGECLAFGWVVWDMGGDWVEGLHPGLPQRLSGQVFDEVEVPVRDAQVRACLLRARAAAGDNGPWERLSGVAPLGELAARTDSQGRFPFRSLPPDTCVDLPMTGSGSLVRGPRLSS